MADSTGTAANRYFLGLKMCFAGHFSLFMPSAVYKVKQRKSLLMMGDNGGRRDLGCSINTITSTLNKLPYKVLAAQIAKSN